VLAVSGVGGRMAVDADEHEEKTITRAIAAPIDVIRFSAMRIVLSFSCA